MTSLATPPAAVPRRRWRLAVLAVLAAIIGVGLYPLGRYVWADVHYQRGLAAAERRDLPEARRHFDVCMSEWPSSGEVRFNAARAARRAGDLDSAARLLKEAKKLGWVPELIELEQALLEVQQYGHQSVAGTLMELVRRGHPDSVLILEVLTPAILANMEMDRLMECLDLWLERAPNDERPRLMKGDVLERMRTRLDALNMYREALKLAPENPEARLKCGWLELEMKFTEDAEKNFVWLMAHKPADVEVRRGMAKVRAAQGRSDEARVLLDALLAENPNNVGALGDRGALELEANDAKAAEKYLKPAVAAAPGELRMLNLWELCLVRQGRDKEAEEVRGRILRAEEDQKKMVQLRKELVRRPHDPTVRLEIGKILMRNGLESEGRRWLETALVQDPRHAETHQTLAEYFDRHADRERADYHRRLAAAPKTK